MKLLLVAQGAKLLRPLGIMPRLFAFIFEPVPALSSPSALLLMCAALAITALTALLWPLVAVLRRQHGVAAPSRSVGAVRLASVGVLVALGLWAACVMALENLDDTALLLPLSQIATLLAFVGGFLGALWNLRRVFGAGAVAGIWSRVLAVLWTLAFAVLLVLGYYHHLLSFNQWY